MLMCHPKISATNATLADIEAVLGEFGEGYMYARCTFVDYFRWFKTNKRNWRGGFIWAIKKGHEFNKHRVNAYLDSHPEISKWDFMRLLDEEADLVDDYWESGRFEKWGGWGT
jgi:hypothetical protein